VRIVAEVEGALETVLATAAFPVAVALEAPAHSAAAPVGTVAAMHGAAVHGAPPAWVHPAAAGAAAAGAGGGD
jgi:hypothetical protein